MAKADTWLPLYVGDYLADTGRFTLQEHGAYMLLIMDYWRNGALPDDDAVIARVLGVSITAWRKLGTVKAKFSLVDGFLRHNRIEREIELASHKKASAEDKARLAAESRWSKNDAPSDAPSIPPSNATSISQAMLERCPSPSPLTTTSKAKDKGARKRALLVPLPDGFGISDRVREWAAEKGHTQLAERLEHFTGYAKRNGRRYADWDEALMNAVREDWAKLNGQRSGQGFQSKADKIAAVQEAMHGDLTREIDARRSDNTAIPGESTRVA